MVYQSLLNFQGQRCTWNLQKVEKCLSEERKDEWMNEYEVETNTKLYTFQTQKKDKQGIFVQDFEKIK